MTTPSTPTTPTAASILYEEHAAISTVLDYLERAARALERGAPVEPAFFRDLHDFFTLFVGQCHHGKEETLLFPQVHLFPEMAGLIAALELEHAQGPALLDAYAAAVSAYADRSLDAAGPLVDASRAYAAYLRAHIRTEHEDLFAALHDVGPAAVPLDLVAAFERYEDEVMGRGTHERLHRMIETLGPRLAPYASGGSLP
jgi:hemerythrin-like domain-containing protein